MRNYNMTSNSASRCGCMQSPVSMENHYALAMAYVPWQTFDTVYEPDKALEAGTIFPALDKPFLAAGRCCRI